MGNQDMGRVEIPAMSMPAGQKPTNSLATVSLVMGIIAVVTSCCFYTVFLFGGLGLIFGLLSRTEGRFTGQAKAGVILSIVALVLTAALWCGVLWFLSKLSTESGVTNLPAFPDIQESQESWENILTIPWRNL